MLWITVNGGVRDKMSEKLVVDDIMLKKIMEPLPTYERPGPGRMAFKYAKGEDVIERLNSVFGFRWTSEVLEKNVSDDFVVLRIRLTCGDIFKEAYGGADIKKARDTQKILDLSNAYKAAFINALKKAAQQFGIGLKDEEDYQEEKLPFGEPSKQKEHPNKNSGPTTSSSDNRFSNNGDMSYSDNKTYNDNKASSSTAVRVRNIIKPGSNTGNGEAALEDIEKNSTFKTENKPAFPKASTSEICTDIQVKAVTQLCSMKSVSFEELVSKLSEKDKSSDYSSVTKVDELTKTQAATAIRLLTTQ